MCETCETIPERDARLTPLIDQIEVGDIVQVQIGQTTITSKAYIPDEGDFAGCLCVWNVTLRNKYGVISVMFDDVFLFTRRVK